MSLFNPPMSASFLSHGSCGSKINLRNFQVARTKRKPQRIWMLTISASPGTGFSRELSSYASQTGENKKNWEEGTEPPTQFPSFFSHRDKAQRDETICLRQCSETPEPWLLAQQPLCSPSWAKPLLFSHLQWCWRGWCTICTLWLILSEMNILGILILTGFRLRPDTYEPFYHLFWKLGLDHS